MEYNSCFEKPHLTQLDLYKLVAKNSSLSVDEVHECFKTYADIYYALISSPLKEADMLFPLPYIGQFYFNKKVIKAGTVIRMPKSRVRSEEQTIVFAEDNHYEIPNFRIYKKYHAKLKEVSRIKYNSPKIQVDEIKKANKNDKN